MSLVATPSASNRNKRIYMAFVLSLVAGTFEIGSKFAAHAIQQLLGATLKVPYEEASG